MASHLPGGQNVVAMSGFDREAQYESVLAGQSQQP